MSSKLQLIIVNDDYELTRLEKYIDKFEYICFDTETTGLLKSSEILGFSISAESDVAYYVVHKGWNSDKQIVELQGASLKACQSFMRKLTTKKLIGHNAVFDCSIVSNYFKVELMQSVHTDTLILAHLLDENRKVGLKELSKSMYGEDSVAEQQAMKDSVHKNGGMLTKHKFEMYKADTGLMAEYGAKDAVLTYKLFLDLTSEMFDQGLEEFFFTESMPLLRGPTYQMNTIGVRVDQQQLLNLRRQLETECLEAKAFIHREIETYIKLKYPGTNKKNTFNIGSNIQMSWLIFGELGLEFSTLTDAGKKLCKDLGMRLPYNLLAKKEFIRKVKSLKDEQIKPEGIVNGKKVRAKTVKDPWCYISCDKYALEKHASEFKWIEKLLEHQKKTKLLNTYVEGIQSRLEYGILQGSFLQFGTTSGRYAARNPNLQNMPRDDKRVKDCLIARAGKVLVGADFSQLEVRVFASMSQDKALLKAFETGEDFYSVIGIEVFGAYDSTPYKDGSPDAFGIKYKDLRKASKELALASTYGASAWQLKSKLKKSEQDTQADIDSYFEKFPGVARMMLQSHEEAKQDGVVRSIYGRPRRLPAAKNIDRIYGNAKHKDLPYEARNILNLAVNHKIQSTAASICNRSMIKFLEDAATIGISDCNILLQVHDEIIVECREEDAETVSILLQNSMENAVVLPGVKLEAIPSIAKSIGGLK